MKEEKFDKQRLDLSAHILPDKSYHEDKTSYTESLFESIRHINEYGQEFWYARELQIALEYKEWRNFKKVLDKAIEACSNSENIVDEHFVEVNKTIRMPKNAERK